VRFSERPALRVAYFRFVDGNVAVKILGGFERLIELSCRNGLVPGGQLIGMSRADLLKKGWAKFDIDCCLPVKPLPRR